ncbi:MAG: hypothetical protein IRZ01_11430 [Thermoflavifilum aggregans]|nr:hypothetical protein [Thermoflavifilum aggregans]
MKHYLILKNIILFAIILPVLPLHAQTVNDYVLLPSSATLRPNQSLTLTIKKLDSTSGFPVKEATDIGLGDAKTPHWMMNGNSTTLSGSEGTLNPDLSFLKATYTAPSKIPAKNPVAISVSFQPDDKSKTLVTLICNIKIVDAPYKVTMHVNVSGPDGLHWELEGESFAKLVSFADGTNQIKNHDGTRNMHLHVISASSAHMLLIGKYDYDIPYTLNVGNIAQSDTVPAVISFDSFDPTKDGKFLGQNYRVLKEVVNCPACTTGIIRGCFSDIERSEANTAKERDYAELDEVKQIKEHLKDPNYLKTPQGKKDLLKMQKIMEERGRGDLFKNLNQKPAGTSQSTEDFVKGMQGTQTNPLAYGVPVMPNTPVNMGTLLKFKGTFNKKNSIPLNIFQEESVGDLKGSIVIKVEKLN